MNYKGNIATSFEQFHGEISVADGTITSIRRISGQKIEGPVLIPGLVDAHVHINEPGRTEWEGFETATKAAVAGGTTTLVDMPLNCIPATTSVEALHQKREASAGKLHCNVGFWGGAVPGNTSNLQGLTDAGVLGFKCFMVPSGVDEFDFVPTPALAEAMNEIAKIQSVLLAHAEDPDVITRDAVGWENNDARKYATYLSTRTEEAEAQAVRTLVELSKKSSCPIHIVHVASIAALEEIAKAKQQDVDISAETCAHYLFFEAEEIPDGATEYKCAPPIRHANVRDALWDALGNGTLDFITTDHSPSPPSLKAVDTGRFDEAWGGIASVQLFLSAVWTEASKRGHRLVDVIQWCCENPALSVGLLDKGDIAVGCDADLVLFDPDAEWTLQSEDLFHRHKLSPYVGRTLKGRVLKTYIGGELTWDGKKHLGAFGKLV